MSRHLSTRNTNPCTRFWVILLTDRQTNAGKSIYPLLCRRWWQTYWHEKTVQCCTDGRTSQVKSSQSYSLQTLRLWWSGLPDARRSATAHFPWQLHAPGTASRQLLGTRRHYLPSGAAWRHGCLNWHWRDTYLILRLHFISFFILITL